MREKSGAGASVSSGASYQARVGAYVIACQICGADTGTAISPLDTVAKVSFETMEEVDDINLQLMDGGVVYIQAKAIISFSLSEKGELRAVLDQFRRQRRHPGDSLVLVTTSRSSKTVTYDLRSALDAYRNAGEVDFYKTQPKALAAIIDGLKTILNALGANGETDTIIKAMSVLVLDIEEHDALEQAIILILHSHRFMAPAAIWGKLVSDCVTFAKSRRVVDIAGIDKSYARFIRNGMELNANTDAAEELFKITLEGELSVAREIVLCESDGSSIFPEGLCMVEFYRFDEDCRERIGFSDDTVILANGTELTLLQRAATFEGMTRLMKRDQGLLEKREITLMPANIDEDIEQSSCAKIQRQRVDHAIAVNKHPLICLHCARPIFASTAHSVELPPVDTPRVGLVHDECLRPADRVLGTIKNEMFDTHVELVDFDATGWFKALHGGQMVFDNADYIADARMAHILWGGGEAQGPLGDFMIEVSLVNGEREIVTQRNGVHRFSKKAAEDFAERLNTMFAENRATDPYVYSDQTKTFGPRSKVLELIGMKETLRLVDQARTRRYDAGFAVRYSRPGSWYAPLLYLKSACTGEPVAIQDTVIFLTNPLTMKRYLENWNEAQIEVGDYRTEAILTDVAFDEFMRWNENRGFSAIVNPILDPVTRALVSGRPIMSLNLLSRSQQSSEPMPGERPYPDCVRHDPENNSMLFAVTDDDGDVVAVHEVFLDADGRETGRRTTGLPQDGLVRFPGDGPAILVKDEPEEGMRLWADTGREVWVDVVDIPNSAIDAS